jgi:UDP:flavonoid glycosyltransferase YjiC (YdhE family)
MARILAYTTPGRGHLFLLVPILEELGRRGHQVALRTLAAEVPSMRRRGFDAAPVSDRIEAIAHDDWRATNPRAALARAVRVFAQRAEHDAADLAQAIDQARPDALLVDVNAWGAAAAAEAWAGPWAMFCPYPLPLRSRDVPPFGPGLPPAGGPLGRLRDQLLRPIVFGTLERTMVSPLNRVRDQLGWHRSVAPTTSSAGRHCCCI